MVVAFRRRTTDAAELLARSVALIERSAPAQLPWAHAALEVVAGFDYRLAESAEFYAFLRAALASGSEPRREAASALWARVLERQYRAGAKALFFPCPRSAGLEAPGEAELHADCVRALDDPSEGVRRFAALALVHALPERPDWPSDPDEHADCAAHGRALAPRLEAYWPSHPRLRVFVAAPNA